MNQTRTQTSQDVRAVYDESYFRGQVEGADAWARFNGDQATLFPRARRNLELLNVRADQTFLDIGCGRGETALAAARLGARVTAVDFAEPALDMARQKLREIEAACGRRLEVEFVRQAATDLALSAASFDRVLMSEFIEHVAESEAEAVLRAVCSALRPDGELLIYTYPNRLARRVYPWKRIVFRIFAGRRLPARMPDTLHPHYADYHLNEQSYFSLKRMLRRTGFRADVWFDNPQTRPGRVRRVLAPWLKYLLDMNLVARARPA